jgi:hypothetical protein
MSVSIYLSVFFHAWFELLGLRRKSSTHKQNLQLNKGNNFVKGYLVELSCTEDQLYGIPVKLNREVCVSRKQFFE